jgi:hypothetical protein
MIWARDVGCMGGREIGTACWCGGENLEGRKPLGRIRIMMYLNTLLTGIFSSIFITNH